MKGTLGLLLRSCHSTKIEIMLVVYSNLNQYAFHIIPKSSPLWSCNNLCHMCDSWCRKIFYSNVYAKAS